MMKMHDLTQQRKDNAHSNVPYCRYTTIKH